jgi:hypothetical protein
MSAPSPRGSEQAPGNATKRPGAEQVVTSGLIAMAAALAVALAVSLVRQRANGRMRNGGLPHKAGVIAAFDEVVPTAGVGYSY